MANLSTKSQPTPLRRSGDSANTIWAIGGGKGGVGKSFISSNIAMCLARLGRPVTLVDLDLGGANLHTYLGGKAPEVSLSDFTSGRVRDLNQITVRTEVSGLSYISGSNDSLNAAELDPQSRDNLIQAIKCLPTSHVILDLGAGTSANTLDFFLAAQRKIVAVTPEPTSIENTYRFLKSSFYRQLKSAERDLGLEGLIEEAMDAKNQHGIRAPSDLIRHVSSRDQQTGTRLLEKISEFEIQILLNQVRTRQDIDVGTSMSTVCRKYFGIEAQFLGYIDHDNAVWQALRKRRPLMVEYPNSAIVGQFLRITKQLIHPQAQRAVV